MLLLEKAFIELYDDFESLHGAAAARGSCTPLSVILLACMPTSMASVNTSSYLVVFDIYVSIYSPIVAEL